MFISIVIVGLIFSKSQVLAGSGKLMSNWRFVSKFKYMFFIFFVLAHSRRQLTLKVVRCLF